MKARTNQLQAFARLALTASGRVLPSHSHKFSPKTYTQPQLLARLLVKEHLRLDYRGAQDLLELSGGLRRALPLRQAPDHSTLSSFSQRKVTPELLQSAPAECVRLLGGRAPSDEPPPSDTASAAGGEAHYRSHDLSLRRNRPASTFHPLVLWQGR